MNKSNHKKVKANLKGETGLAKHYLTKKQKLALAHYYPKRIGECWSYMKANKVG